MRREKKKCLLRTLYNYLKQRGQNVWPSKPYIHTRRTQIQAMMKQKSVTFPTNRTR